MQQIDIAIRDKRGEVTKPSHPVVSSGHISSQCERDSFGTLIKAASPIPGAENSGKGDAGWPAPLWASCYRELPRSGGSRSECEAERRRRQILLGGIHFWFTLWYLIPSSRLTPHVWEAILSLLPALIIWAHHADSVSQSSANCLYPSKLFHSTCSVPVFSRDLTLQKYVKARISFQESQQVWHNI